MFDPLEIQNDVIDLIREKVPAFQLLTPAQRIANVREYDDEFRTENEQWEFGFPCALVRVVRGLPRFKYVDGGSDCYDYDIVVFIAHDSKDDAKTHPLEIVKQVRDALEGEELTLGDDQDEEFKIQCGQFDFLMKVNATAVYTLDLGTIP